MRDTAQETRLFYSLIQSWPKRILSADTYKLKLLINSAPKNNQRGGKNVSIARSLGLFLQGRGRDAQTSSGSSGADPSAPYGWRMDRRNKKKKKRKNASWMLLTKVFQELPTGINPEANLECAAGNSYPV